MGCGRNAEEPGVESVFSAGNSDQSGKNQSVEMIPLNYPVELEEQALQAMLKKDGETLGRCYRRNNASLRAGAYTPKQMKETLLRFGRNLANKQWKRKEVSELKIQNILGNLAEAVTWEKIGSEMETFLQIICGERGKDRGNSVSQMVQKAKELIWKYYSEGITLEEDCAQVVCLRGISEYTV